MFILNVEKRLKSSDAEVRALGCSQSDLEARLPATEILFKVLCNAYRQMIAVFVRNGLDAKRQTGVLYGLQKCRIKK